MNQSEIKERCRSACGAEAVVMGFPDRAGYDIHDGCVADDFNNWSEDRFIGWVVQMQTLYGTVSPTGYLLIRLYEKCNEIMGFYGELAEPVQNL